MTRRREVLIAAVAALALLNILRWTLPDEPARSRNARGAGGFQPEDFQLKVGVAANDAPRSGRNLFQPRLPPAPPPVAAKVAEVKVEPPPAPPPKSPEELAEEAARAEIQQIKLVGVVFRGEKGQAFLVKGAEMYMVQTGGKVGDRFQVEAIRPDSIQLKDPATRITGQIPVLGK